MDLNIRKTSIAYSTLCQVCKNVDGMYSCLLCNKITCIRCIRFKYFCFYCAVDERNSFTMKRILKENKKKNFYDKYPCMKYLCFKEKNNKINPS
jgi:hypothetical protein